MCPGPRWYGDHGHTAGILQVSHLYIVVRQLTASSFSARTTLEVFLGQWLNQSFNAFVNYTNRNAKSQITNKYVNYQWYFLLVFYFLSCFPTSAPLTRQIAVSYVSATTGAVAVSVGMNSLVKVRRRRNVRK